LQIFHNTIKAQLEQETGEALESFLDLVGQDKSPEAAICTWQRGCRAREFTEQEIKYITTLWQTAKEAYETREAHVASPPAPAETSEPGRRGTLRPTAAKAAAAAPAAKAMQHPAAAKAGGGRVKQTAKVRRLTRPVVPADVPSVTSDRHKGKTHKKRNLELPLSDTNRRVLPGQLQLNQDIPKTYSNANPLVKPPVEDLTISKAWHVVRLLHITTYYYFSFVVVIGSNELITTHYYVSIS
jgi:hypothetical protein